MGLDGLELRRNWKLRQFDKYESGVRAIQSRGIGVNGCFVLGLDGHDESVFDNVFDFSMRAGLFDVQITVPTPFPGTPMLERLWRQGRILHEEAWGPVHAVRRELPAEGDDPRRLERGLVELAHRLYEAGAAGGAAR